jgi:eukaryotic-like serine/threonine-protein kinase
VLTEVGPGVALSGGRYALERLLGAGGMATVWLAMDRRLERQVAVKVLSDALAVDGAYIERFEREARLAAGLSHANLVAVYDFGNEGRPYLVMEHVDGPTLGDVLCRASGRGEVDPVRLARALLGALDHIHGAGIVHRDVKPSNVLMGGDGPIRLTDFGIARPENGAQLTLTGQVMGTLRYLAPEVKAGGRSTPRSDLYASGILLSDVLADRADPSLRELVRRLCHEDPTHRPASAAEALADLPGASLADPHRGGRAQQPERLIAPPAQPVVGGPLAPTSQHTVGSHGAGRSAALGPLTPTSHHTVAGRNAGRRARAALALVCASAAVVAISLLALGGSGSPDGGKVRSSAPRASAPISAQLDAIEREVRQGRR